MNGSAFSRIREVNFDGLVGPMPRACYPHSSVLMSGRCVIWASAAVIARCWPAPLSRHRSYCGRYVRRPACGPLTPARLLPASTHRMAGCTSRQPICSRAFTATWSRKPPDVCCKLFFAMSSVLLTTRCCLQRRPFPMKGRPITPAFAANMVVSPVCLWSPGIW